jgi:peptidoglycan/LPS O-acetylase OafA/YrhL
MPDTNELYCQQNIPINPSTTEIFGDRQQQKLRLNNRVEVLDYARFFAAMIVVLYHYTANGFSSGNIVSITHTQSILDISKYGYLGVELFFMISGYVILFSAWDNSPSRFAVSRAVRIYPSYIFAVLITSFCIWQWGAGLVSPDLATVLANFTMFQFFFGYGNIDNVYWTLVYELIFYFAVFLILMSPWRKSIEKFVFYWPFAMGVAFVSGLEHLPLLGGYFYYFAAGALFALFRISPNWKIIMPLLAVYGFCLNFTVEKSGSLGIRDNVEYSQIVIISIVTLFFLFFIFQNLSKIQNLKLPTSRFLGSLTYPVYLIHGNIGYILINRFATEDNKFVIYLMTLAIIIMIAVMMNKIIEVKCHHLWKKWFNATLGAGIYQMQVFPERLKLAVNKIALKINTNRYWTEINKSSHQKF